MRFNTKEMAIHSFTLALTYNSKEVRTRLPIAEALLIYEHTKELLLEDTSLLLNQYQRIHLETTPNGSLVTVFEFQ